MRTASALVLALAFAGPAAAQDAVSLKWTLKEGDTFFAKGVTNMDMSMGVMGQNIDLKMKITAVQRFKVTSVKSGATTIEMTMLDMQMDAAGIPGGVPGVGGLGERVKGATITATLNDEMRVTKLTGYEKFLDKIAGDDEAMRKQLQAQLSEGAVSQMISQVFSFGPDKPVKVGDTWNRDEKVPAGGFEATVKQKFKLDSVTGGVAKIGLTGDMVFKAGGGIPGLPPGVKVDKFDMKADKFAGTLLFDTKTGRLTENKQDMNMNGAITLSANGQTIDMTMKIKVQQNTVVTDKNPIKD